MRPAILVGWMLPLLAACAGPAEENVDFALACQLRSCVCAHQDKLFFKTEDPEPVRWKENGDAYCPEGLELRFAED